MIITYNGCYFTPIKVVPANWNTKKASTEDDWYFYYRFYDPTVLDKKGKLKPKLMIGKGMNRFKSLAERQQQTKAMLAQENKHLVEDGFNPITTQFMKEHEEEFFGDIPPETPFIQALTLALSKLSIGHRTYIGIKSVIKGVEKAAVQLRFQEMPINIVGRKHLKKVLERCESLSKKWSNGRYNAYRAYLLMLFNELVEQEAVTGNPVRDISKRVTVQKLKVVLTEDERLRVDQHLKEVFPRFHAFVHLFFHSGGRKTELFQLKPGNVNLEKQTYRCVIKKRKKYTEVERTIKDVAVPFWEYFLEGCKDDQFIFGTRFKPGDKPMGIDMPSRYWTENVKAAEEDGGLGIKVDFYSLKHLNTTEIVDRLDEEAAAQLNAQTSTAMVRSVYDVKQRQRQHEKLKKVSNKFA